MTAASFSTAPTPPRVAPFSEASIPKDSWKQFAHLWGPDLARTQYAKFVLNLPLDKAYDFARSNIPGEELARIKAWHFSLTEPRKDASALSALALQITGICSGVSVSNLDSKVKEAQKLLESPGAFMDVLRVSYDLTLSSLATVGLVLGSAMLRPKNGKDYYETPQHPRDGDALIRLSLRRIEDDPELLSQNTDLVKRFREKFPSRES